MQNINTDSIIRLTTIAQIHSDNLTLSIYEKLEETDMLLLSREDIKKVFSIKDAIEADKKAFVRKILKREMQMYSVIR